MTKTVIQEKQISELDASKITTGQFADARISETSVEQYAGTNSGDLVQLEGSPAALPAVDGSQLLNLPDTGGAGIGNPGQTWNDVTGSRTDTTIYTNTYGEAIQVVANCTVDDDSRTVLRVRDPLGGSPSIGSPPEPGPWVEVSEQDIRTATGFVNLISLNGVVPDNWQYQLIQTLGPFVSFVIRNWAELRPAGSP